jgi:hypothetical protein
MTRDLPTITLDAAEAAEAAVVLAALSPLARDDRRRTLAAARTLLGTGPAQPRKPRMRTLVKQAEAATGKPVTAITLPDGTKLDFTEATDATADDEVENWFRKQKEH